MKRKWLIGIACIVAGSICSTLAYDGKHVNAEAVSVQFRYTKWYYHNEEGECCECQENQEFDGSICLYTIRDAKVTHADTIYEREQGLAQYPAFDLTGRRVAFFRKANGPQGPNGAGSCVTKNDGKNHISVINADGTGLRDLCDLPGRPGAEEALDWPAGEWIYYVCPKTPEEAQATGNSNYTNSVKIWKVNAQTGVNQEVCDLESATTNKCRYWRRFSLSLTANRVAVQGSPYLNSACSGETGYASGNGVFPFPPPNCPRWSSAICAVAACNAAISPSGTIVGHYMGGAHIEMWLTNVNTCKPLNPGTTGNPYGCVYLNSGANGGDNLEAWAGEDFGSGCEHIGWAVNSDKWVMQEVGWFGHAAQIAMGGNQVVMNWVDKVAINISKNPKSTNIRTDGFPTGILWNNQTGDMWIDDPVNNPLCNKYEDLSGVWHEVPGASTCAATSAGNTGASRYGQSPVLAAAISLSSVRVRAPEGASWALTLATADGKALRSLCGRSSGAEIPVSGLQGGVYVLTLRAQGKTVVQRCIVR